MAITVPNAVPAVVKAVNLDKEKRFSWNITRFKMHFYLLLSFGAPHLASMANMAGEVTPSPKP